MLRHLLHHGGDGGGDGDTGALLHGVVDQGGGVVVVALMAIATTFSITSSTRVLNPTEMLLAGPARTVVLTTSTEKMTGAMVVSSTPS